MTDVFGGKREMEGVSLSLLPPASGFDCEHAQEEKDQSFGVMTDIFFNPNDPSLPSSLLLRLPKRRGTNRDALLNVTHFVPIRQSDRL